MLGLVPESMKLWVTSDRGGNSLLCDRPTSANQFLKDDFGESSNNLIIDDSHTASL
jgi:hypothetical protein